MNILKNWKLYIIIILLVVVAFSFYFFFIKKENVPVSEEDIILQTKEEFQQNYINLCKEESNIEYCQCTFEYMYAKKGLEDLIALSLVFSETGEVDSVFEEAMLYCLDLTYND